MSLSDSIMYGILYKEMLIMKEYNMMQLYWLYKKLLTTEDIYKYSSMVITYHAAKEYKNMVKDRMLYLSKVHPETRDIEIFRKEKDNCFGITYIDILRKTIHNDFFKICITSIDRNPVTLFKRGN